MAIVRMKRVGIVGPADISDEILQSLQGIALLDPVPLSQVEDPPSDLLSQRLLVQRVIHTLEQTRSEKAARKTAPPMSPKKDMALAEDTVKRVEKLTARRTELETRLGSAEKEIQQIRPWGDFDPGDLDYLEQHDVFLRLYETDQAELSDLDLSRLDWHSTVALYAKGRRLGLLALRIGTAPDLDLDRATLANRSLSQLQQEQKAIRQELAEITAQLLKLSTHTPALKALDQRLQDRIRYHEVRSGLGGDTEIFALSGWCPTSRVGDLRRACQNRPVAFVIEDPDLEDDVPIALRNGPLVRQFQPLLKAFNLPHYREYDPTLFIAPFMGLFFGFCLGDLGYGTILTGLGIWAQRRFKPTGEARLALQWLVILGIGTMVIGTLTGNLFGVKLYELFDLSTSKLLFSLNEDPKKFFYVSLIFGVVQLTVGMLIRLVRYVQEERWQHVIGSLGWLSIFPTLALWATMDTPWPFVAALLVILLFASPDPSVIRRIGGGAWALYNITGLVGDVMSYARIFGLGLSSAIIAMVVNTIAMTVVDSFGPAGWIVAVPILVGGHSFNFLMAIIGAVVHPARLQFLEFFGKFFEGGGRAYAPFQKIEGE